MSCQFICLSKIFWRYFYESSLKLSISRDSAWPREIKKYFGRDPEKNKLFFSHIFIIGLLKNGEEIPKLSFCTLIFLEAPRYVLRQKHNMKKVALFQKVLMQLSFWILKMWYFKRLKSCQIRAWSSSEGLHSKIESYLSL